MYKFTTHIILALILFSAFSACQKENHPPVIQSFFAVPDSVPESRLQVVPLPWLRGGYYVRFFQSDGFIQANTSSIGLNEITHQCIIPVFAKDNESTISHSQFIESVAEGVQQFYSNEEILLPAIRVSHAIKGRIPEAMGKPAHLLSDDEKTIYYERMAFMIEVPSIRDRVGNSDLSLVIGGVRAYNHENLYSKKSAERFKLFIGFKNLVCTNLCISTDGFRADVRARTLHLILAIRKYLQ